MTEEPIAKPCRRVHVSGTTGESMRVLLVDDHKPTRDEMRSLIERQPDMVVVAEADTGEAAVDRARNERPDVVVMDILLPGINGIEASRRILAQQPDVVVLALSNHFGESLVQAVLDAGGQGYVRKSRAFEELIPALRSVAAGQRYVSKER
ncbi:MAG: response regulator transcription factor [Kiritimatiellae bacterium]|nr:response regulator transcription factor [Kiritimatiellia bacterium]